MRWNIILGRKSIEDRHMEDCNLDLAPRHSTWFSKGPLCDICARVIHKAFPSNDSIKLRYAAFIQGLLTLPEYKDEQQQVVDVVLCNYDLDVGLDRFYLAKGSEEDSAYFLNAIGSKNHMYVFVLEDYITFGDISTQNSLETESEAAEMDAT